MSNQRMWHRGQRLVQVAFSDELGGPCVVARCSRDREVEWTAVRQITCKVFHATAPGDLEVANENDWLPSITGVIG